MHCSILSSKEKSFFCKYHAGHFCVIHKPCFSAPVRQSLPTHPPCGKPVQTSNIAQSSKSKQFRQKAAFLSGAYDLHPSYLDPQMMALAATPVYT